MHYIGRRASDTNPLRSLPLYTPAARVFGPDPLYVARTLLWQAEQYLPRYEARVLLARAALGRANRERLLSYRRVKQADAMRGINLARRELRKAVADLAICRANLAALEQAEMPPPALLPTPERPGRRTLREQVGTFPAGSRITVEPGRFTGFGARIVRPDGSGVATHLPTEDAALAWVDAQLAAPVLH